MIFQDTFTDTDAVQLQSHTPDTGTSWTRLWSDAPGLDAVITSNRLSVESNADDGIVYTADGTYPTANYKITVTRVAHTATGVRPTYWILRLQDIDNFYAVRFDDAGAGQAQIYKKVAGSFSTIGSAFVGPAAGSVVEISINGDTITVVDDSVTIATETDTDITAAGKAGVGFGGGTELVTALDDANAGNQWDDLTIEDLGAPTEYNQATAGTLTSAGTVVKQTGKGLSGTLTNAGIVVKNTAKSMAGSLTSAGALTKQASKSLGGTLASSGSIIKAVAVSVAGSLTSAGALVKQTAKSLVGTLTSAGAVDAAIAGTVTAMVSLTAKARDFSLTAQSRVFALVAKARDFSLTAKDR